MSSITATWQTAIRMRLLDWYRWMPASAWVYIPFLTSSVPDLSFDGLVINSDCSGLEFHSYRCSGLQGELISWKPSQQLRLPHRGISDKHNLEDIVYSILVLAIPGHHRWRVVDRSISKAKLLNFCKSVQPILKSLKNTFVLLRLGSSPPPCQTSERKSTSDTCLKSPSHFLPVRSMHQKMHTFRLQKWRRQNLKERTKMRERCLSPDRGQKCFWEKNQNFFLNSKTRVHSSSCHSGGKQKPQKRKALLSEQTSVRALK